MRTPLPALCLLAGSILHGEAAEIPQALNLPTADTLPFWDLGVGMTHRFAAPVKDHGKDAYGLDGYAYTGVGLHAGIKWVKGLSAFAYRTSDNKTVLLGLQQRFLDTDRLRAALKVERFDETVQRQATPDGTVGLSGADAQMPVEAFLGEGVVVTVVPTWLSRTTTRDKGVFNVGAGLRWEVSSQVSLLAEYYPRPSGLPSTFKPGFAAGISYRTLKHRFTLLGTNVHGTTPHQVLGGDYAGGPVEGGRWSLGFNLTRTF